MKQTKKAIGKRITCTNGHQWRYKGKKKTGQYATCPACLYKVRIP